MFYRRGRGAPRPEPQRAAREDGAVLGRPLERLAEDSACLVQATNVRPLHFGLLELDVAERERDKVDLGGGEVVEDELE